MMGSDSDSFDLLAGPPEPRSEPRVLSVSEVTKTVRAVLEQTIGQIWVEGEVSNYRKQASGHQYFTLKDEYSQLPCVMFARPGMWRKDAPLADGMCVQARGMLTVYEARGQYQLNVQLVQASGAGLLQAKFEALKRKLEAEGLFDPDRKRPLPPFPTTLGIVTSPTGAALRDMLNILTRRAPWMRLIISPVRVQGDGAAEEVAAAVEELNRFDEYGLKPVDIIVVARGGGSAEDLWEFNEEIVARAIAASEIPVVSAVGHEIDFTISDFVADLRAPTPSAAAELVAPDTTELIRRLSQRTVQMQRCLGRELEQQRQRLASLARSALFREPRNRLNEAAQRIDFASDALRRAVRDRVSSVRQQIAELLSSLRQHRPDQLIAIRRHEIAGHESQLRFIAKQRLGEHHQQLQRLSDLLRLLSPQATLERGYTITTGENGELLKSVNDTQVGATLTTRFKDGVAESEVKAIR
ncbi:exodeoxyribonuclease VII large subunit [Verrucomicrobiota bacterium sgz303538]